MGICSRHVVLLLQVDILSSHCDSYQGKTFLQCPSVHHCLHIKSLSFSPVLFVGEGKRRYVRRGGRWSA